MSVALLVMTDGRGHCLERTIKCFGDMVTGPITARVIHDDSGDPAYRSWLLDQFPAYHVISTPGRSGFGGAIRSAWRHVGTLPQPYVLHLEDDFEFRRPVDLSDLASLLEARPYLSQVAFRRQAWGPEERAVGGFIEQHPDAYTEHHDGEYAWLEHSLFFTSNPCLYRRQIIDVGWPEGERSEGHWGLKLRSRGLPWGISGNDVRSAFWGSLEDGRDWVWHIGDERVGTGY